nr:PLP-dependent aspartate aminotransferase family protein [Thalassobacillus sp. CUG 92003]
MMSHSFDTKVVHSTLNQRSVVKSKTTPIYQTSAFSFANLDELEKYFEGESDYLYSRMGNPNTDELAASVAQLEGAERGVATSSGMSAILAGILAAVKPGEHIVAAWDVYGGTHHLLSKELPAFGIQVTLVDFSELERIEAAIQTNTRLLYSETLTNPFLRVENVYELVALADRYQLYTMLDNTFATPYLLNPFELGVDLIAHSATKYLGGHSDITAGVVVGREQLVAEAEQKVVALGTNLSPHEAWLTQRGLKTLSLRMSKQSSNAQVVADFLREEVLVEDVHYPAYVSEKGNGAIITLELGEDISVERFFESLGWIKITPTLAGVETTVSYPIKTSHRSLTDEQLEAVGIDEQIVRLSVGIEDVKDIKAELQHALTAAEVK